MDFRDYAAKETSALMGRIVASRSDAQLRTVREALDAAARAVEAAVQSAPKPDDEVRELVQKLSAAAGAASQKIQQESQKQIDAARREIEGLQAQLKREVQRAESAETDLDATIDAHKQVDAERQQAEAARAQEARGRAAAEEELRGVRGLLEGARAEAARLSGELESEAALRALVESDFASARGERDALNGEIASMRRQIEAAHGERDGAAAEGQRVATELASVRAQLEGALAERNALGAERDTLQRDRDSLRTERDVIRAERDAVVAERETLRAERDTLGAERDGLIARASDLSAQVTSMTAQRDELASQLAASREIVAALEQTQKTSAHTVAQLEARLSEAGRTEAALREQAAGADARAAGVRAELSTVNGDHERVSALLERSVAALDEMGGTSTVTDLLASIVRQLAIEFPRVALFRVKGNHLEGEHCAGLDATDVTKLVIPLSVDSIITKAATAGSIEHLTGAELTDSRTPFGGTPAVAMALPIQFQQETLAVVYADSDVPAGESQAAFAKLIVRHGVVLLTRLSQELKTLNELRDYAAMLLQEAEQMFAADVEAGKPDKERRRRLQETIECARQLYAQRAALESSAAAGLLDEQIAAAVTVQPATAFARDLAAATGQAPSQSQSRRTAS